MDKERAGIQSVEVGFALLEGLTRALACEMASRGITVNAVAPGFIDTPMTEHLGESVRTQMLERIPCGRFGAPEDVAYSVLSLLHPRASYLTGQILHVNGGMWCGG